MHHVVSVLFFALAALGLWGTKLLAIPTIAGLAGLAWSRAVGPTVAAQDRVGYAATVLVLVGAFAAAADAVTAPLPSSIADAARMVLVVGVLGISRLLLGFGRADLGLGRPRMGAAVLALVAGLGVAAATVGPGGRPLDLIGHEILFRGFVLATLRDRTGRSSAMILTTGASTLALAEGHVGALPSAAVVAALATVVADRCRSVWPVVTARWLGGFVA